MRINVDSRYNAKPDFLMVGYMGETNSRTITFEGLEVDGADLYKMQIKYADGNIYELDITDGSVTLGASVYRQAGYVTCQILACKSVGDTYTLVKKSNLFRLKIGASNEEGGIPTYERSIEALDKVLNYESRSREYAERAESAADRAEDAQADISVKAQTVADNADKAAQWADTAVRSADKAEQMSASAEQSAASASKSADTAGIAADNADTSAQTASAAAEQAKSSADTAAGYSTTAGGYARTASESADNAANSAAGAANAADNAGKSATAAKTAQTAAESARDTAVQAQADVTTKSQQVSDNAAQVAEDRQAVAQDKTAAETAATEAEQSKAAAQTVAESIPADYNELSNDVSQLKEEKANQLGINLARDDNVRSTSLMVATKVENEDGTVTITPTADYGRLDVRINVEPSEEKKYYYIAYKFKASQYTKRLPAIYCNSKNVSKGMLSSQYVTIGTPDAEGYISSSFLMCTSLEKGQTNIDTLDIGIMTNTNIPYTIQPNPFIVIDVTDLCPNYANFINFASIFGYEHFNKKDVTNQTICNLVTRVTQLESTSDKPETTSSKWKDKNALVIGDSLTAAMQWQKKLNTLLGMNVTTHAKGGVGTIAMVDGDNGLDGDYDNETSASGTLKPLSVEDVAGKELIVVLPAYNDRGKSDGNVGDCYNPDGTGQKTIAGVIQYSINRIYTVLKEANNLKCKILYATPHCAGKYPYINADGYDEYPTGSGQTMETLANKIIEVCNHNNIPVCDLWHNSGINKFTWDITGASSSAINTQYSQYKLDSTGNLVSDTKIKYVNGKSYYQLRDGEVVLEEYTGSAPYPYNGDQLHCSDEGYNRIGECIVGSIINYYGN